MFWVVDDPRQFKIVHGNDIYGKELSPVNKVLNGAEVDRRILNLVPAQINIIRKACKCSG